MAGRFNTNLARDPQDGTLRPIPLVRLSNDLMSFAVGGEAEVAETPRFGFLVRQDNQSVVAVGALFKPISASDRNWGMIFTADRNLLLASLYTLRIQSEFQETSPDQIIGLHFEHGVVVSVQYPTAGTVCTGSVVTYGSFAAADTRMTSVVLKDLSNSSQQSNSMPYYNPQGFWASSFTLTANHQYQAEATGDISPPTPGGPFTAVVC